MRVLVVFETMFGNTKQIAQAVAAGLAASTEVEIDDVGHAPTTLPADVDALILGGPTHVFSMSRPSTRANAARRGASADDRPLGIREWLQSLPVHPRPFFFAAFDTRTDMALVPGAASRSATRLARKRGFHVLEPKSFYVQGYQGPLVEGEVDRARNWGAELATILTGQRAHEAPPVQGDSDG
jgi:hypothetical protein